ncbi:SPRY domain-containing protein 4 isoform X1 [Rhinatrema bivittatum]|uniref:SPRY domain-containing protein 4 isoform X1 n=1 Tax=Rhinatrema bivittatum TaxID=194408 RepID=UPI001127027F|nr:SPRY domain-containing protein 4 isoform X1 [Rhinatrema bivittatum]
MAMAVSPMRVLSGRSWAGFRGYVAGTRGAYISFKLDEKTAHSSLDLIRKDTGVIYRMIGIDPTKIPQNLERFREWAVVLGDTPVSAGRHYWEVTVKRSQEFRIGAADADMSRDECIGVNTRSWVFAYSHKKWHAMLANKTIPIVNIGHPAKVGLLLDYEAGKLSLVDAEKHSLIHTIAAKFLGPVVPAFGLWDGELLTHSGLVVPEYL